MLRFTVSCACGKVVLHRVFQDNDLEYSRLVGMRMSGNRITASGLRQDIPIENLLDHVPHGGFYVAHGPTDGLLFPDAEDAHTLPPRTESFGDVVSRYLQLDCDACGRRLELASDALRQMMTLVCPSCCVPTQQYPYEAVRASLTETRLLLMTLSPAQPIVQAHIARFELDALTQDTLRRLFSHGDAWTLSRDLGSTTSTPRTKPLARLEMLRLVESRERPNYGGSSFAHHQYRVTMLGARLARFYAWREQFAQERSQTLAQYLA